MKRLIFILLIFSLMLGCLMVFSSCVDENEKESNENDEENEKEIFSYSRLEDGTYGIALNAGENPSVVEIPLYHQGIHVTQILSNGFENATNLQEIKIPKNIVAIGANAFAGCTSLKKISFANGSEWLAGTIHISLEEISNAETLLHYLTSTYKTEVWTLLDKGLVFEYDKTIQAYEVDDYTGNAKSVVIPSTYQGNPVKHIGNYAFAKHTSLESITIAPSVTSIGYYAFQNCTSLKYVEIPNSVTELNDHAFSGCSSLTSVMIPNSIILLRHYVFSNCNALTSIYYGGSPGAWNKLEISSEIESFSEIYYYSESAPAISSKKYWHYVDGVITIWE